MTKTDTTARPRSEIESSAPPRGWPDWLPLALILVLATVLRLYRLGAENLWIDEIFSIGQATDPVTAMRGYWAFDGQNTSRPLGLTLLYWALQFGNSEFLVRLPYAILSILDVAALYFLSRELVERRVALRATVFLALLPIHVWYAQEVRWYSQWTLLATVSFLALVRLWKSDRLRWWFGYTAAAVLALYTFVISIQLIAVQALSAWLLPDRGRRWSFRWKVGAALSLATVAALPVFLVILGLRAETSEGMVGTPRETTLVVLPYLFFSYIAGYTVGPSLAELHALPDPAWILREYPEVVVYYLVFLPIVVLGLWSLRGRRASAAILVPWVVAMPLLVFASAIVSGQTFNVRYSLATVPGFALLLSLGAESLGRWRRVGTLAVVGLFAFALFNFYVDSHYDKEDVRGALAHVRASAFREAPIAVVGQGTPAVAYYGSGLEFGLLLGCDSRTFVQDDRPEPTLRLDELRSESEVWLLESRDWEGRAERCSEELMETHVVRERASFPGTDLLLLEHR